MVSRDARDKGLRFTRAASTSKVRAEPIVLIRILSNLVANAVKYTRSGAVLIGCRRRGDRVWFCVLDTGPGMSAAGLARVMRPHERGAEAGDAEGLGLGLAIAARLASERGYLLETRSAPGRGSAFAVAVPIAR